MRVLETIGVLALGAGLIGGAGYAAHRVTRGTHTEKTRRKYSQLLGRAAEELKLFEKSLRELRHVKRKTPPKLFTLDVHAVRELLAKIHRRETRACIALAAVTALRNDSDVPLDGMQLVRRRRLLSMLRSVVQTLRELEKAAGARGVRLDNGRRCDGDAPSVEALEERAEERRERRLVSRARVRQRERERPRPSPPQEEEELGIAEWLDGHFREADGDEDHFGELVANDRALLRKMYREDRDVLVELANDYPAVWDAAKSLGLLDSTRRAF